MTKRSIDTLAVAMDWLDAYSSVAIDQLVTMYSSKAIIECGCGHKTTISGTERIFDYLLHQTLEYPALGLHDIWMDGDTVVLTYRSVNGIIWAFLDIAENGLIVRCQCGPMMQVTWSGCPVPTSPT